MKEELSVETFRDILEEYHHEYEWLLSLISDPLGKRYFVEKTPEERRGRVSKAIRKNESLFRVFGEPAR